MRRSLLSQERKTSSAIWHLLQQYTPTYAVQKVDGEGRARVSSRRCLQACAQQALGA
jgi:hypothetical protein